MKKLLALFLLISTGAYSQISSTILPAINTPFAVSNPTTLMGVNPNSGTNPNRWIPYIKDDIRWETYNINNFNNAVKIIGDALYMPLFIPNSAFNKNWGTTSNTAMEGNDSRVVNALSVSTAVTLYQPLNSNLSSLSAAPGTTAFGISLLNETNSSALATTLGLGTAAFANTSVFANAAQGVLAASALQSTSPLNPANVSQTTVYRFTTDTEKGTWNAKQNAMTSGVDYLTPTGDASGLINMNKAQVGLGNVDNTSDTTKNSASVTLTNKTMSGSSNTFTNIGNSSLSNSTIVINGNSVPLGGSTTITASPTIGSPSTGNSITSGTAFQPRSSGPAFIMVSSTLAAGLVGLRGESVISMSQTQTGTYIPIGPGTSFYISVLSVATNIDGITIPIPTGWWVKVTNTTTGLGASLVSTYTRWDM